LLRYTAECIDAILVPVGLTSPERRELYSIVRDSPPVFFISKQQQQQQQQQPVVRVRKPLIIHSNVSDV
jgi:hypothetical protein